MYQSVSNLFRNSFFLNYTQISLHCKAIFFCEKLVELKEMSAYFLASILSSLQILDTRNKWMHSLPFTNAICKRVLRDY